MKRFYKDVTVAPVEGGFAIRLDGRPVRTPARAELALPNAILAEAIAQEWRDQGETVDPATMAFTGLTNAAIDHIAGNREKFAADIADYGGTDMLCYRAEGPESFIARQAAAWDPLLDWARTCYDVAFVTTQGIIHVAQPDETLARLAAAVTVLDPFVLAGLSRLVTLSGSLVCGLAVLEGAFDTDAVWEAAEVDERWQAEQWGEDAEALARSAHRAGEFAVGRAFCAMARA